jgi:uncharacterized protein (TIGR02145 family)
MNMCQKQYADFIKKVCIKYNCTDALQELLQGFDAFCSTKGTPNQTTAANSQRPVVGESVRIGDLEWTASNLQMPADPENGIFVENGESYFTWKAAKEAAKRAGRGWRLPTQDDWEKLVAACGGSDKATVQLRSVDGWSGKPGKDAFGFAGKPTGSYSKFRKSVIGAGEYAEYWSATSVYRDMAIEYDLSCTAFMDNLEEKMSALSVRLVRG